MEQCPNCYEYMDFHMEYFCGNPIIYYTCPKCGYDERNVKTVATTSTTLYESASQSYPS